MANSLFLLLVGLLVTPSVIAQFSFPGPPSSPRDEGVFVPGGYLPPPRPPVRCDTNTITRTSTRQVVSTRTSTRPGGVSTAYVTRSSYVATTLFTTATSVRVSTAYDNDVITQTRGTTSVVRTTVGGGVVTRTVALSTIVPMYIENTRYSTVRSSDVATRTVYTTQIRESVRPVTNTITQSSVVTSRVVSQGRDVTQTTTRFSTVQIPFTIPGQTRTVVSTRVVPTTIARTTAVTQPAVQITRTQVITDYRTVTRTTTVPQITTITQRVTSTVFDVRTVTSTSIQRETSQIFVDRTSNSVSRTTVVTDVGRVTTQYNTRTETRTVSGRPVIRTSTVRSVITVTGPGGENYTSTRFQTNVVSVTSTVSRGTPDRTIFATTTIQQTCTAPGYEYTEPSTRFNF